MIWYPAMMGRVIKTSCFPTTLPACLSFKHRCVSTNDSIACQEYARKTLMPNKKPLCFPGRQTGVAALLFALLVMIVGVGFLVTTLSPGSHTAKLESDKITYRAMANAKDELIGFAVANSVRGYLPCPADPALAGTATEGTALSSCNSDALRIGRLPWRTLGLGDLRDGYGEPLWYAVSGNFTNDAAVINRAASAATLVVNGAVNATAIIFSVGAAVGAQQRGAAVIACATTGGAIRQDYCATNYLDTDPATGVSNADADTTFAQTRVGTFNDVLLTISTDQFFGGVEKRVLQQVRACLRTYANDPGNPAGLYPWAHADATATYLSALPHPDFANTYKGRIPDQVASSVAGIGWSPDCPLPSGGGAKSWLRDWHELLFYAVDSQYAPSGVGGGVSGSLTVNGTPNVRAVVILAGAMLPLQNRSNPSQQYILSNYLDGTNASSMTTFGISPPPYNDRLLIVAP